MILWFWSGFGQAATNGEPDFQAERARVGCSCKLSVNGLSAVDLDSGTSNVVRRKHIARAKRLQCRLILHLIFILVVNECDWPGTGLVGTSSRAHRPGRKPNIVSRDESKSVVHFFGALDRPLLETPFGVLSETWETLGNPLLGRAWEPSGTGVEVLASVGFVLHVLHNSRFRQQIRSPKVFTALVDRPPVRKEESDSSSRHERLLDARRRRARASRDPRPRVPRGDGQSQLRTGEGVFQ